MVKKLFALASVTALSGLVATISAAGCSSTEVINVGDASLDAKRDAPRPPNTEESDGISCKANVTFEPEAIKAPAPQVKVCDAKQIAALAAACVTGADADPNGAACKTAREKEADAECASCIFGADTDAQWKVINLNPGSTRAVRYNQAGCIEHASGVKDCGAALLNLNICLSRFCSQAECPNADDQDACFDEVLGVTGGSSECEDYLLEEACATAALDDASPKKVAVGDCFAKAADDDVRLFTHMATVACGSGNAPTDGGTEAGTE